MLSPATGWPLRSRISADSAAIPGRPCGSSSRAKSMPFAVHVFGLGTRLLNFLLGSQVRFQHLPVPFELYADGIDLPVFEEFGAGTAAHR